MNKRDSIGNEVRITLGGVEVSARADGAQAGRLAALVHAALRRKDRPSFKAQLTDFLAGSNGAKAFAVSDVDLHPVCEELRRSAIRYCVLKDLKENALTTLLVRSSDAVRVARIFRRLGLDVPREVQPPMAAVTEQTAEEAYFNRVMLTHPLGAGVHPHSVRTRLRAAKTPPRRNPHPATRTKTEKPCAPSVPGTTENGGTT